MAIDHHKMRKRKKAAHEDETLKKRLNDLERLNAEY